MKENRVNAANHRLLLRRQSSPDVIANVVVKAINARGPKTRYAAGQYAKTTMFMRKWFGDRFYDKMVMTMLKYPPKNAGVRVFKVVASG